MNTKYSVDEHGYFGQFGGAFVPEMLYPNVRELQENYLSIIGDPAFRKEFDSLLKDYVGRPTPLFFSGTAERKIRHQYLAQTGRPLSYRCS